MDASSLYSDYLVPGDFARNVQGTIYEVVKVNRVNTVCRDKDGKLWNVRGILKKADKPADWTAASSKRVRPGTVFQVKPQSGLWRKQWFRQYTAETLFVSIGGDQVSVKFVPLGGEGMPETTANYSTTPDQISLVTVPTKL